MPAEIVYFLYFYLEGRVTDGKLLLCWGNENIKCCRILYNKKKVKLYK